MRHTIFVAALFSLAACTKEGGIVVQQGDAVAAVARVRSTIDSINTQLSDAFMKGDSTRAASYYDAEAMVMPQGMNASSGRDQIRSMFGGILSSMKVTDMKLTISDVFVDGNLAIETGRYQWTLVPSKGKPMVDKGKYVVAWRKQADGSWKLFRDIFNNDAPESTAK